MTPPLIPDWRAIRAVVFDVDGTLYDAPPVRRRMALELLAHCVLNPRRLGLLRLLQTFRRSREEMAETEALDIPTLQYRRPAEMLGISERAVADAVAEWILERPLKHVARHRAAHVDAFFDLLRRAGRPIGVHADYPTGRKLAALGLSADVEVSANDADVARLKPHPAGLEVALRRLGCAPAECLMIGDREERDGAAARRLGVPFLLRSTASPPRPGRFRDYAELISSLSPLAP